MVMPDDRLSAAAGEFLTNVIERKAGKFPPR